MKLKRPIQGCRLYCQAEGKSLHPSLVHGEAQDLLAIPAQRRTQHPGR